MKIIISASILLWANLIFAQVKIGDNINTIDPTSIMELESASKVFVVTRLTTSQMNAITPINGALAYNIDSNCLFQYRNNNWESLCVDIVAGETVTSIVDNKDGTFSYFNESGNEMTITKSDLTSNNDGTYSFTNGNGIPISFVGTDSQNASQVNLATPFDFDGNGTNETNVETALLSLAGNSSDDQKIDNFSLTGTTIAISNENDGEPDKTIDLDSAFATDTAIAAVQADVDQNETDADNAIAAVQADVDQNETDADNAIAAVQADVDQNESDADNAIAAVQADVDQNETDADAAIALKEDTANKSTDVTLADGTNTKFPTELAVKTYVDNQITATADDDITGVSFDGTNLKVDEGATSFSADLSALEESAAIAAVQADVDQNESDADTAIAAVQTDVDQNETDADAAIALKEDTANKSIDVTLADGTNTKFPTELAVKTYVDNQITATADDDITGVSFDGTNLKVDEGATSFSADLSALEESAAIVAVQADVDQNETDADAAIAAVQSDVDQNETDADTAIAAVQSDVDQNETDADAAIALKEDAANKSTAVALGTSDVLFPTQNAVKTYVDGQITATADDDITDVSFDGTNLTVDEGATSFSADLSALEESAAITAVQNDVNQNETDADSAIAAVQADVDQNETDADNAIAAVQADVDQNETDANTAIAAVQSDVDQNETDADAAIALKENTANKSTAVALGTSDVLFPTQNAVKTYVDGQITATADDDITDVSFDGTNLTVDEGATSFSADLSALEESAAITAVQNDVNQNETDADSAIAAVQADVDQNETDADNAIAAVQADVDQNETDADTAIAAVQSDVDQNETDADAAIALKENTANKSTAVALGTSDVLFPTQNAVKTYVDGQITATADDDITGVSFDGTNLTVDEGATSFSADLSALEESAAITAVQNDVNQNETDADSAIAAVQADVDQNETDADNAIAAVQADVDQNETDANTAIAAVQSDVDQNETDADAAIALKENTANKSTAVALGTSDVLFPTQNAVKTYVDGQITATADDDITDVSFDGTNLTVDEGATSFSADLSALEESAAITAVQNDVNQNETDADSAIAAVQADVDQNETDADNAIAAVQADVDQNETDADTAIAAVQSDVDQNETDADAAIALKENTANKSTAVALGTSDVLFPTQNAVKTYVDGQITATADDDITGVSFDGTNLTVDEGATSFSADLSALEESAAIAAVQTDVDQNETDADTAIALKEDAANKSTDITLADGTNTKFPTELAVKTYVDNQITATTDDDITGVSFDGTNLKVDEGATSFSADLSALEESAAIAAVQTDVDQNETDADNAIAAVQADVDQNESDADNAIAAVQADVDQNETDADAAIALKEDTANKSTDVTLADGTNTKFPTELAVKTYVDNQITATADDDITGVSFDGTNLKVDEGATSFSADLSALEESAAIAAVQADVDQNESDADTAIAAVQTDVDQNETDADAAIALKEDTANKSTDVTLADGTNTKFPTELAVKTYVDNQITATADDDITGVSFDGTNLKVDEGATSFSADLSALEESAAITAVQADVDQNETDADTAIAAVQSDVDQNETDADTAIALKEDAANKSTAVALGTSDVLFPTQNAVKTYVDGQITATADDDITGVSFDGTNLTVDEGATSFSADLSALEESAAIAAVQADVDQNETDADTAIAAIQSDVDQNETDADSAIAAVQADVDQNETDADAAIALKEDAANKSTDITLADGTNTKFPTELAVKTYVDNQITATADDDITGVSFDGTNLKVDEGATSFSADLSALEESAAITAVQADVDQNETDADSAIAAVQADVDQNETDADAAIALKEDAANKSTDVTLADGTNTKFPTELAVKTYVDNQITATTDDDITGVSFDGTNLTVDEGVTSFSADLSALEESAAITAVQNDVNQNETDADSAIAAVQADVDQNETDADSAIAAVQADVDQNETDADAAIALKEDAANKSTDVTLADGTNTKFPTELAVKTYVDNQITATTDDDITGVSFDGTNLTVDEGVTSFSADLSALEESAAITAVQNDVNQNETDADSAIAAVQADVDQNETDADSAIAAVQADVDQNETDADAAIALKEDAANKSTDVTLADGTNTKFPTELAVKTYVDNQITATADDDITGVSFDGTNLKVDEGATSFSADLSALEESAAIAAVQADVDQNETDADTAIALKEDAANKSTDITLADGTNTKFPTELAVKTYVDGQITATADDDITGVSFDGTDLTVDEGATSFSADLSALEESAAIAAVQADVDLNESDADTAIAAVQADVDLNESDADAAIALKEDAANKSTDITLADGTNTKFPTELAVKTYVDGQITATADDDITGVSFDGTDLTVDEGATSFSADLSALEESAAITAVQADVDLNESDADAAIAAVQADVDLNESDADAAIAAVQADVDLNESDADAAIALKEDAANKSTDITLADGTNTKFPTELAVKTYVDNQITATADDDITGVSFDGTDLTVDEGATSFSADLSALEESAAIAAVQADVDLNESDADAAIALKENTANKSTAVALGTSDVLFPTQNAVKTYVDGQITATADDDITDVSFDGTNLKVDEGATSFSADLSALEESAAIAAVQTDVDQNETDADAAITAVQNDVNQNETDADSAIAAVQADVDQNETDADAAIALKEDAANKSTDITLADGTNTKFPTELAVKTYVDNQITATADDDITGVSFDGTNLKVDEGATSFSADLSALEESAAITAVQADVDQNETDADAAIAAVQSDVDQNETDADAAIALKEDTANKSTAVALGTSDVLFPTQNAVKTYVDGQITATADDDITGVSFDGTNLTVDEGATSFSADLSALEESAAIAAVQTDVDQNETDADNAIAAVQADVDQNETDADSAIAAVQADVDQNETDADAAIALKEDAANKSTDITLADGTNTKFPTELAVKTYVDGQITASDTSDLDKIIGNETVTSLTFDGTTLTLAEGGNTDKTVNLSSVDEDTQDLSIDVTGKIISLVDGGNVTINSDDNDADPDNEIQVLSKSGTTISLSSGGGSVNETTTTLSQNTTTGVISYTNESGGSAAIANVVSTDANNTLAVGTDGGAYSSLVSPIKAFGKIDNTGGITKATIGVVVAKLSTGRYRVTLPAGAVSDANYIIQLTQPGRGGAGNDDPGISYSNQTATSFEVIIGDNDNGSGDRARFNSEFMFTVLDL